MYLGKSKVKSSSLHLSFQIPKALDEVEKGELYGRLQAGDETVISRLITGHMGLAISIVGRYITVKGQKNSDDYLGIAFLALCEGVKTIPKNHPNLTGYLTLKIHGRLANHISREKKVVELSDKLLDELPISDKSNDLRESILTCCETETERIIIQYRLTGLSDSDIARNVGLAPSTVQLYRKRIEAKIWNKITLNG